MKNDLISRQAAIDALEWEKTYCSAFREGYSKTDVFEKYNMGLTDGIKAIKNIPSAQPERKKGEWIDCQEDGYVECPFCHSATNCDGNKEELHFCFSCGADMRG